MAPKKGAVQKKHGYVEKDLLDILDKCIPIYKASNIPSFHTILQNHCTYQRTNWEHWTYDIKSEEIIKRFEILRDIQEDKFINGAMTGEYNPAFSMFFLKSKRGWIERQHSARLELEEKKMDLGITDTKDIKVEINVVPASIGVPDADED